MQFTKQNKITLRSGFTWHACTWMKQHLRGYDTHRSICFNTYQSAWGSSCCVCVPEVVGPWRVSYLQPFPPLTLHLSLSPGRLDSCSWQSGLSEEQCSQKSKCYYLDHPGPQHIMNTVCIMHSLHFIFLGLGGKDFHHGIMICKFCHRMPIYWNLHADPPGRSHRSSFLRSVFTYKIFNFLYAIFQKQSRVFVMCCRGRRSHCPQGTAHSAACSSTIQSSPSGASKSCWSVDGAQHCCTICPKTNYPPLRNAPPLIDVVTDGSSKKLITKKLHFLISAWKRMIWKWHNE